MSEAERKRGMDEMSAKYHEVGGRLYVAPETAEEERVTAEGNRASSPRPDA